MGENSRNNKNGDSSENTKAAGPMKFHVKGNLRDLLKFKNLVKVRTQKTAQASPEPRKDSFIYDLSRDLHPKVQHLVIDDIREETATTKMVRLVPDPTSGTNKCAYFRAGQYLSVKFDVGGALITRPYSIASSPADALNGFYNIAIKKVEHGFITEYLWGNWKVGDQIRVSEPLGFMYYDPFRDAPTIVGIAGGSGISPFRSLAREIISGATDIRLHVIYGSSDENDIIFYGEFKSMAEQYPNKVKVTHVLSCEEVHLKNCEQGFITSEIIQKYTDPGKDSYFLCGPAIMYDFVTAELEKLKVPKKRIRREAYGEIRDVTRFASFPQNAKDKTVSIKVHTHGNTVDISALAEESVLIALERAKLAPPSACRSGECQLCRTRLMKGDIWVSPHSDGRRLADIKFGYFHPCASFPVTDLEIELPLLK